jgi:hypothetical protein
VCRYAAALGLQAAEKCTAMRLEGCEEMGSLVMGIVNDLMSFDFADTFVNGFEAGLYKLKAVAVCSLDACGGNFAFPNFVS